MIERLLLGLVMAVVALSNGLGWLSIGFPVAAVLWPEKE